MLLMGELKWFAQTILFTLQVEVTMYMLDIVAVTTTTTITTTTSGINILRSTFNMINTKVQLI
eukprot:m.205203 g.205203  ORF g.205203 m.205203 type:complete len:63 (-) comp15782_c0_seq18:2819-3007(-)